MNSIKCILIFAVIISACRNKVNSFTDVSKDSTIVNLEQLKETELTRIEITPMIYFADTINKGDQIEGKFAIVNRGKIPFTIKKVVNICGCTVTESTKKEIQPQDSYSINFKIDTDNFREGFNVRTITIMGNFHPFYRILYVECFVRNK